MTLEELLDYVNQQGWKGVMQEQTEISPQQIVIALDTDLYLRLTLYEQEGVHFLQFYVLFPVEVKELEAISTLILRVNSGLDMGGFQILERDQLFFFRTVWMFTTFDPKICNLYFEAVAFLIDQFVPTMTAVAKGEQTLLELEKEAAITQELSTLE